MSNQTLGTSSDEFGTPWWLYHLLDDEFRFSIDACASKTNTKHGSFVTKEKDAFLYQFHGHRVFCNPPYNNGMKEKFARLAHSWTGAPNLGCPIWVMLLSTCTDQAWFHELIKPPRVLWYPIKGRVQFDGGATGARDSHMILVFRNQKFLEFQRPSRKKRVK